MMQNPEQNSATQNGQEKLFTALNEILPAPGGVTLTVQQENEVWTRAVEVYQSSILTGHAPGEVMREIVNRLKPLGLSKSETALERQLYRKAQRVAEKGQVVDMRAEANRHRQAQKFSDRDRTIFVYCWTYKTYGEQDKAWEQCIKGFVYEGELSTLLGDYKSGDQIKFSQELLARYPLKPNQRPRCPKWARFPKRVIRRVLDRAHRPVKARQSGAFIICRHDDYFAGDWRTSDDFTLELYFATEPGDPTPLRRGQFLLEADCRSKRILQFGLIDAEGYRQDEIRLLWKKSSIEWALPRRGWHLENGIWKTGKLLGGKTCDSADEIKRNFAERLGLEIRNSLPASPRGKIIENIGKLLQRHIRGECRWVGPNEQVFRFEHSQAAIQDVQSGRKTAKEAGFLTHREWVEKLRDVIIPEYNATEQDSKVMGGDRIVRMSPDRAWEALQPRDSNGKVVGVEYLPEDLHWLFAHQEIRTVGRNGIRLSYAGGLNYKGGDSGKFLGLNVIVYFDPENTESLVISDLKKVEFGVVPRDEMVPRWSATRDQMDDAYGRIRDHDAYPRMLLASVKSAYKPPARRITADAQSRVIGQNIADSRARLQLSQDVRNRATFGQPSDEEKEVKNTIRTLNNFLNDDPNERRL